MVRHRYFHRHFYSAIYPIVVVAFSALALALGGCKNALLEAADTETPEAILFEVNKLLNRRLYNLAIEKIETLDPADLAKRDVVVLRASAYAGRCGLDFTDFVDHLQEKASTTTILQLVLSIMKGATSYDDCLYAEDLIEGVGATAAARTDDENLLLALVSLSKIGAILAVTADADNDGLVDAGFDACTGLDATQAGQIGTGISLAYMSLNGVDSDTIGTSFDDMDSVCSTSGLCTQTDPTAYTSLEIAAIKTAVHDDDGKIGLATQPSTVCTP